MNDEFIYCEVAEKAFSKTNKAVSHNGDISIDYLTNLRSPKVITGAREYQREKVASLCWKQQIMLTVLTNGYTKIPQIHIRVVKSDDTYVYELIDGQQRITSITLFLIYLNNLQKEHSEKVGISDLIFSESYGEKSFNMTDEVREPCLKSLFEDGAYKIQENDDETVKNMVERYEDISESFPEELSTEALPYFLDWFVRNVVIVKITAYSDENAYTIFETMNDRGLNLSPTEMLKGYVLSRVSDTKQRTELNDLWKEQMLRCCYS
jgi:uncharacterized protein with ParB-like and HNH nuclease domain